MKKIGTAVALVFAVSPLCAADTIWEQLLNIGSGEGGFRWKMPLEDVDNLIPQELRTQPDPRIAISLRLRDGQCLFDVSLYGVMATPYDRPIDRALERIGVRPAGGSPEECRTRIAGHLRKLYGMEVLTRPELGWRYQRRNGNLIAKGGRSRSIWSAKNTCASLVWLEGSRLPPSAVPFSVQLMPGTDCEYDDGVVGEVYVER